MDAQRETLEPIKGKSWRTRRRSRLRQDLLLAVLPTVTVLGALYVLEEFSDQRLLFASLASSAFLIYLDPLHATNTVRSLVIAHLFAAAAGLVTYMIWSHGYQAAATAMLSTIVVMVFADAVHPPAVSTSLIFGFKRDSEDEFLLFVLAVAAIALLVLMQRLSVWGLNRATGASAEH